MRRYVVTSTASAATPLCVIVTEQTLRQYFHGLLCTCDQPWETCELDDVVRLCKSMDEDDCWTYNRFQWEFPFCDGRIEITVLTEPISVTNHLVNPELERWARDLTAREVADMLHTGQLLNEERHREHDYEARRCAIEQTILFLREGGLKEGQTCP